MAETGSFFEGALIQGPKKWFENIVKKDPGRAKQNSLATAVTNFTKPGAQNKVDPGTKITYYIQISYHSER